MTSLIPVPLFFFNDTATTEIYTLSLHDALPIYKLELENVKLQVLEMDKMRISKVLITCEKDRKSTRLNSSHANISYAVFCLKKKTTELRHSSSSLQSSASDMLSPSSSYAISIRT